MKIINIKIQIIKLSILLSATLFQSFTAHAEEGMWPFFSLPLEQLKEKYHFTPDTAWINHVRLSSLQLGPGSGAFISPDGLIMTNHHVVFGSASKINEINFVEKGFFAPEQKKEVKLPGMAALLLVDFKNVTAEIESSYDQSMPYDTIESKINQKKNELVATANKENNLLNRVVFLNNTNEYWVYTYKSITDIRLVFAPEVASAAFGGYYYDNFTYPRYNLDVSFVRAYENDIPYKPAHYFKWKTAGAQENELVFIPGNPGSTNRFLTMPELLIIKDYLEKLAYIQCKLKYDNALKNNFVGIEPNAKLSLENRYKVYSGIDYAFRNKAVLQKEQEILVNIVESIKAKSDLIVEFGNAYSIIDSLAGIEKALYGKSVFEFTEMKSYNFAEALYMLAYKYDTTQKTLSSAEIADWNKFEKTINDTAIIKKEAETEYLTGYLQSLIDEKLITKERLKEMTGRDNANPAAEKINLNTGLYNSEYRLNLMKGGKKALEESADPMIEFVLRIQKEKESDREISIEKLQGEINKYKRTIARAYNIAYGNKKTADANFTLRFSYGTVKGYQINGYNIPWQTTLYGLFDRAQSHGNTGDYKLPKSYWDCVRKLDLATPCNFVTTNDIVGGNSGSSVINKNAEIIGLVFDGNYESNIGKYVFDDEHSRAVCVHPAYIIEALRKIYKAGYLADEIEGK